MRQYKRTVLRTLIDAMYTLFLPILPPAILYSVQALRGSEIHYAILFLIWLVCAGLMFFFTFFKNSIHYEVDDREVRYYKFGKLIHTFPLNEYSFTYDSHVTSAGVASLKFCAKKEGSNKQRIMNSLGLGENQVKEMLAWIHELQAKGKQEAANNEMVIDTINIDEKSEQ